MVHCSTAFQRDHTPEGLGNLDTTSARNSAQYVQIILPSFKTWLTGPKSLTTGECSMDVQSSLENVGCVVATVRILGHPRPAGMHDTNLPQ